MGEIADMMINGDLCQLCGCYMDEHAAGHPRTCADCQEEEEEEE